MKKYSIRYSPLAQSDLVNVWNDVYEASKDYDTTDTYIDELMNKIKEKEYFPKSGTPLMYGNLFTGFYYVCYKMYIAFYRVNENKLEVSRIMMSKTDYMKILFEDS